MCRSRQRFRPLRSFGKQSRRGIILFTILSALSLLTLKEANSHPTSKVGFIDILKSSGVTFLPTSGSEKKYIPESMGGGVVLFDFDNDGWLDIYFTNSVTVAQTLEGKKASSELYRNNRDGTFSEVSEKAGVRYPGWAMGGVAADFDNDGWEDLYVTCFGPNLLYRNNGDGTFTDVTESAGVEEPRWSTGAAFGDLDRDGHLDLFVSNYVDFRLDDLPAFGEGVTCNYKGIPVQCGPRGLKGAGDSLFHANGDGTFTNVSEKAGVSDPGGYYGLGVMWLDYDDDGWGDLYVANDATPNFLYRNNRDGTFNEVGFESGVAVSEDGYEQGGMPVSAADYDHSGRLSIFVGNFSGEYCTLYRNDGAGRFSDVSYNSKVGPVTLPMVTFGGGFFDYDNDGWSDLLITNGHVYPQVDGADVGTRYRQPKQLLRNKGDGKFEDVTAVSGAALSFPVVSRGAAFGDINNDGSVDVVVENLDGPPEILLNSGMSGNHWITLRLAGSGLNRQAIGSRVVLTAGDIRQMGEVQSGGSYLCGNDLRLHFGLGSHERVDQIKVRWPGGEVESFWGIPADQFVTLKQGTGVEESRRATGWLPKQSE